MYLWVIPYYVLRTLQLPKRDCIKEMNSMKALESDQLSAERRVHLKYNFFATYFFVSLGSFYHADVCFKCLFGYSYLIPKISYKLLLIIKSYD